MFSDAISLTDSGLPWTGGKDMPGPKVSDVSGKHPPSREAIVPGKPHDYHKLPCPPNSRTDDSKLCACHEFKSLPRIYLHMHGFPPGPRHYKTYNT